MSEPGKRVLERMLERLYAAISGGPALNCRPHRSRQRLDCTQLAKLEGPTPEEVLAKILGAEQGVRLQAHATLPPGVTRQKGRGRTASELAREKEAQEEKLTPEQKEALRRYEEQQALLTKIRLIAEDAKTFEQDTGSHALYVGYPILHLPPNMAGQKATKRIVAPIALIPVNAVVKAARVPIVELSSAGSGSDRVVPNTALLAWLERNTGVSFKDIFADEDGADPWREIQELVAAVAKALDLIDPLAPASGQELRSTPKSDDEEKESATIASAAVLGLFPLANLGLVRDVEAMLRGEVPIAGPVESFLRADLGLADDKSDDRPRASTVPPTPRSSFSDERLITGCDPCQARAVRLARTTRGLVVHGPPGTGKSQTIANIIGDHLARGERVLFVCDKRTALDVVHHRLDHLGLGRLCAVVHDAQRDQRDLYMGIREQLEALPEAKSDAAATRELVLLERELEEIHRQLTLHHQALSERGEGGAALSFHELVGQWLAERPPAHLSSSPSLRAVRLDAVIPHERAIRELLERGRKVSYPTNPWSSAAGIELKDFLARPSMEWRRSLDDLLTAASELDETCSSRALAFPDAESAEKQGWARASFGERVRSLVEHGIEGNDLARWATRGVDALRDAQKELQQVGPFLAVIRAGPLDPELVAVHRSAPLSLSDLVQSIARLVGYLSIARRWYAFFCFGRKREALEVLRRFGVSLGADAADRVRTFLEGLRARRTVQDVHDRLLVGETQGEQPDDRLQKAAVDHERIFELLLELETASDLQEDKAEIRAALADPARHVELLDALRQSARRGKALTRFASLLRSTGLCSETFIAALLADACEGRPVHEEVRRLVDQFDTLEDVLRIAATLRALPAPTRDACHALAVLGASPDDAYSALRKAALAEELSHRLRRDPILVELDRDALEAAHARYRELDHRRKELTLDAVLHLWTTRQRERLLASTYTRLNGAGAELKRRLTLRGQKAMRVRQVIAAGAAIEGGDPLFDVRPVWMASPQTVAQIFPREPIFDVVIFDEASQCRLEEALPVLLRAKRVVVAGDPKQLPPTRFFESAVTASQDADVETDQDLFEEQQSDVEDLLGAALNLEIEQCYLDVHYRSRDAGLIEFSNRNFYEKRLQAIPGHPSRRAKTPPLVLHHVGGIYEKRTNIDEAKFVVALVRKLLAENEPPSIGIACFNLAQRDLILETLDQEATADEEFGARLAEARARRGAGSFEGLFVKNLENVQGDERDHIIISTTYGPDPTGKFYRRFGPLGMPGGGRRLNVLVTRARDQVHLVTSIPQQVYRTLPPVDDGKKPNGGWLLFAYLLFAEHLQKRFDDQRQRLEELQRQERGEVTAYETASPSGLTEALASYLADQGQISSEVYWGNDGFCVDMALRHPQRPFDVTIGVLCDGSRFTRAADSIEWDIFRADVLRRQGWTLHRVWSPELFRDVQRRTADIRRGHADVLRDEGAARPTPARKNEAAPVA